MGGDDGKDPVTPDNDDHFYFTLVLLMSAVKGNHHNKQTNSPKERERERERHCIRTHTRKCSNEFPTRPQQLVVK